MEQLQQCFNGCETNNVHFRAEALPMGLYRDTNGYRRGVRDHLDEGTLR